MYPGQEANGKSENYGANHDGGCIPTLLRHLNSFGVIPARRPLGASYPGERRQQLRETHRGRSERDGYGFRLRLRARANAVALPIRHAACEKALNQAT